MLFNRKKYAGLIFSLLLLLLGFILMSGPEAKQDIFDESIFCSRRLSIAPLIIIVAYINMIYLILRKHV